MLPGFTFNNCLNAISRRLCDRVSAQARRLRLVSEPVVRLKQLIVNYAGPPLLHDSVPFMTRVCLLLNIFYQRHRPVLLSSDERAGVFCVIV